MHPLYVAGWSFMLLFCCAGPTMAEDPIIVHYSDPSQGLVLLMPYSLIGDGYSDRAQAGTPIRLPIRGAFGCTRW